MQEKEINRLIGQKIQKLLVAAGYEVVVTRSGDTTTALGARTSLANQKQADLFLSIHANAGAPETHGAETFFFDPALLKSEMTLLEPASQKTVQKVGHDWQILSKELALLVQERVVKTTHARDKGIKKGVIQVLLGFQGPAALIEVGYLSNKQERASLCSDDYQKKVAEGIFEGIKMFIDKHFA